MPNLVERKGHQLVGQDDPVTRILLRAGKDPFDVVAPADAVRLGASFFATNTGNLLFADSVHRLLSTTGTELVVNHFESDRRRLDDEAVGRINDEFDHVVLPLANAFRPGFARNLENLASFIERLRIPVTVVGVGAQAGLGNLEWTPRDEVAASHRRFVDAVLDHSPAIGVRGEVTAAYLGRIGYGSEHVEVIGCPSLFLRGPDHRVVRDPAPLQRQDPVALNVTPTAIQFAPFIERAVATYPNLTYLPQRDWELLLMLWGRDPEPTDPRMPTHREHPLYREDRMRFFLDSRSWIDFLSRQRFSVGTRLHGTVAAILGGVPAMMVCHDSRTFEVAEYHRIPFIRLPDLPEDATVESLYEQTDYTAYQQAAPALFDRLCGFLERSGLRHVATPDEAGTLRDYDARLAALPLSPGVRTLRAPGEDGVRQLEDRLAALHGWLDRVDLVDEQQRVRRHAARLDRLAARIEALEGTRGVGRRIAARLRRAR